MSDMVTTDLQAKFDRLLPQIRPRLHRYCARMVGSTVDGEDVVQDALVKAIEAFGQSDPIARPEGWLFRIAHNAALDFLCRRARHAASHADQDLDLIVDPASLAADPGTAARGLRTFMHLPVAERSSVLLMDLMGYSLIEIGQTIEASVPAAEAARLGHYVERFNARDFDPAILVGGPRDPAAPPRYFILLAWVGPAIATIRDFRYAPYVMEGAELRVPV